MKLPAKTAAALALLATILPASAADDAGLTRMALCQDSWLDWTKTEPARFATFRDHFMSMFSRHGNDPYMLPKASVSVLGLRVLQAFPQSVGMGVGFSLTVDATFDDARKGVEKALGKTLQHCESSDGMRDCELEIGAQRTVMLMSDDAPKTHRTLIGCYYFYEK
jgi:hypothetical protein